LHYYLTISSAIIQEHIYPKKSPVLGLNVIFITEFTVFRRYYFN
jgi:hypothetical protein